jgi:hypothetical protein
MTTIHRATPSRSGLRRPALAYVLGLPRLALVTAAILLGLFSRASVASAAGKDAEAEELAKKAIYTDYLGTKFGDAEKRLKQALTLCEPAKACSAKVRAQLLCNLGIVYIGGMNRTDDGKAKFAEALKQDPGVTPDPDLVSPEIEAAFAEVKKAPGGATPAPTKPEPAEAPAGNGDMVHTAPTEQATLTPLPLYAELPAGQTATRVQLSYKPFGAPEWKTLEMKSMGKGFGVEVPCAEIGSALGDLKYYIQAFDSTQNLVSWTGARAAPHKVAIRLTIQGEAPHLPGRSPPDKCPDKGDCPPEFPGCHDKDKDKPPTCEPDQTDCVPEKPPAKKNWISLAVQQDFLILSGANNTCTGASGAAWSGYDCFMGSNYYPDAKSGLPYDMSGDQVKGGFSVATTRILAGYDRAVGSFTIGARVGYAFRGGPTTPGLRPFFPVHAELRAAYWFGSDPFARTGVRPYLTVVGGVAQIDAKLSVIVYKSAADYMTDTRTQYDAWRKVGLGFVGGGVGMLIAVTPRMGPFLEVKFVEMLGISSPSLNLQLGYALGL